MQSAPTNAPQASNKAKRSAILIVEDEVLVRTMIAEHVRNAGFSVIECTNADEGLAVLRSGTPIDLVISDVRMPGSMDGVAFAKLARAEFPTIKIFLTSGHLPQAQAVQHDGFFAKPYDLDCIVNQIRVVLG